MNLTQELWTSLQAEPHRKWLFTTKSVIKIRSKNDDGPQKSSRLQAPPACHSLATLVVKCLHSGCLSSQGGLWCCSHEQTGLDEAPSLKD
ncbi:hypothetical protein WJX77_009993 [Trebouxia sp. C0004]